jgi:sugar-specific transcriptional regulator TrmB
MTDSAYKVFFDRIGLSDKQQTVYLYLLKRGGTEARQISKDTKIPRTLCYKIIDDLVKMKLVYLEERPDRPVYMFYASSPLKFGDLISDKKAELEIIESDFSVISGLLSSEWNRAWGKPNISLYEGIDGLKKIFEDIIFSKPKEILIVSSPLDKSDDFKDVLAKQIALQVKNNIKVRAITPLKDVSIAKIDPTIDQNNLIIRKIVKDTDLPVPAQIIIYNDKISITNFSNNVVNFVIQSQKTADTLRMIFDFLWRKI